MQVGSLSGKVRLVFAGTYSENQTVEFSNFNSFAKLAQSSWKEEALLLATVALSKRACASPDLVKCILMD